MGCRVAGGALAIGLFILKVPALLLLELKLALLLVPLVLFHLGTLLVELVLHILRHPDLPPRGLRVCRQARGNQMIPNWSFLK